MGFLGLIGFGGGATGLSQGSVAPSITGGTTYEYSDPDGDWKSHSFTHPQPTDAADQFVVTGLVPPTAQIEVCVVGGGGAGGADGGSGGGSGGGGGGGYRLTRNSPGKPLPAPVTIPAISISPNTTYPITVGAGGEGGVNANQESGGLSRIASPTATLVEATGGGGGGWYLNTVGANGGCGGGGSEPTGGGGETVASPDPLSPTVQGTDGKANGGGGGGAASSNHPGGQGHAGGLGFNTWMMQGPTHGGHSISWGGDGDRGGTTNGPGVSSYGGGGSGTDGDSNASGSGGHGVVIIRYNESAW